MHLVAKTNNTHLDNYCITRCACSPKVNKPRVVVTDFRLHYIGFTKWSRWLLEATQHHPVLKHAHLIYVNIH